MLTTFGGVLAAFLAFPALMWVGKRAGQFDLLALIAYIGTPNIVFLVWGEPAASRFFLGWSLATIFLSVCELARRHQCLKQGRGGKQTEDHKHM